MNLNVSKKQIISRSIWSVVGMLLAIFFIRIAVWENQYYAEKEGSARAVIEEETANPEVDETEITEQQIVEYTVPADRPRYLSIEKLGIQNARVLPMGLKEDSELSTPNNIFDVGWYDASGKPGQGGTMLIDGHNGGPTKVGVFKYLGNLSEGDIIKIERGDGVIYNYEVVENIAVPLEEADNYMSTAMKSPVQGKESLSIITCTGDWSQARQTYLSRQFLRATLVE